MLLGNGNDDNNQASIRNPPGAFHNAGSALAQNNLLGSIIQQIKMQSVGIWQRLLTCFETTWKMLKIYELGSCQKIPITLTIKENEAEKAGRADINMKMKILIELCAHIGIWWWHLCKTMLLYLSVTVDKILAETRTHNTICLIRTASTTTTYAIDNSSYKNEERNHEEYLVLLVGRNKKNNSNSYGNNNNNNNICNNWYRTNIKTRQTYYNGHTHISALAFSAPDHNDDDDGDADCDVDNSNYKSSRNRQQIINVKAKYNNNTMHVDDIGVGNKIANCRMLPTPLATCLLFMCNLLLLLVLLLLLLLCISFPAPLLHLVLTTWTTHFISILSIKRAFSTLHRPPTKMYNSNYSNNKNNTKEKTKNCCDMKINRRPSFNSGHHLNAITTTQQQQQQHIQSFKTTITTIIEKRATIFANTFSKIVNCKVSLR